MKRRVQLCILGMFLLYVYAHGCLGTGHSQENPVTKLVEILKDDDRAVRAEADQCFVEAWSGCRRSSDRRAKEPECERSSERRLPFWDGPEICAQWIH